MTTYADSHERAIAARALREFATPLLDAAVKDDDEQCPDGMCGRCTQGNLAQLAIFRADEIERGGDLAT